MPPFPGFPDERERWRLAEPPLEASPELRLGGWAGAGFLLYAAWRLGQAGRWAVAACAAAGAALLAAVALRARQALCPRCGGAFALAGAGPERCPACPAYGYFQARDGRAAPLPPGSRDDALGFRLNRSDLAAPPWRLPWEGACCACGAPPVRRREVRFADQVSGLPGVAGGVETVVLEVPVCAEHADAARSAPGGGIAFRSYDYWLEFVRANGVTGR